MRNMRSISIRIRSIVSGLDTLLLLLLDIGIGEPDEFLTFSVHPRVVLVTIFVANSTLVIVFFLPLIWALGNEVPILAHPL
jgi:hypothetical protein